jgi:hypothetical protein
MVYKKRILSLTLILGVCILLRVRDQGESVFRLYNVNIVGLHYLFNCATCFGHTIIFRDINIFLGLTLLTTDPCFF